MSINEFKRKMAKEICRRRKNQRLRGRQKPIQDYWLMMQEKGRYYLFSDIKMKKIKTNSIQFHVNGITWLNLSQQQSTKVQWLFQFYSYFIFKYIYIDIYRERNKEEEKNIVIKQIV